MPHVYAVRIRTNMIRIADGDVEGLDIKMLKGMENTYRHRVGPYRAIYRLTKGGVTLLVLAAGPRGDVYK